MNDRSGALRFAAAAAFSASLIAADLGLNLFDSLRGPMSIALSPFRFAGALPAQASDAARDYFRGRAGLLEEKRELEEKLLEQSVRISSLDFFVERNAELRALLALKERAPGEWIAADVRRETTQLQQDRVHLDRGVNGGVLPGMTVVDERGVVGQVVRADADNSAVNLLSNTRQWIAARVRRTGQLAIVRGSGGAMEIYAMPGDSDLRPGDELIAEGGVFPEGYPVGEVAEVSRGVRYLSATVRPASDFYGRRSLLIYAAQSPKEEAQ